MDRETKWTSFFLLALGLLGSQVGTHAGLQHLGAVGGSLAVLGLLWCAYATWKWAGSFHPAPQA